MEQHDDGLDALALEAGTRALTDSASSMKSTEAMPSGETMSGVPSRVMPTKATLTPPGKSWIAYGGKIVSPLSL